MKLKGKGRVGDALEDPPGETSIGHVRMWTDRPSSGLTVPRLPKAGRAVSAKSPGVQVLHDGRSQGKGEGRARRHP